MAYAAPEQHDSARRVDARADVYALGLRIVKQGFDTDDVVRALEHMGRCALAAGRRDTARRRFHDAYELSYKLHGLDHRVTLLATSGLAACIEKESSRQNRVWSLNSGCNGHSGGVAITSLS